MLKVKYFSSTGGIRQLLNASFQLLLFVLLLCSVSTAADQPAWIAPRASKSLLLDLSKVGERYFAVGHFGHLLTSPDGTSWTQQKMPTSSTLTAVSGIGRKVWAVGHDAVILFSDDAGVSWQKQNFAPEEEAPLLDILVLSEKELLAIGAYGLALRTEDGGANWKRVSLSGEDPHYYMAATAGADSIYIAGEYGLILHSADRGLTWQKKTTPYEGTYFGVVAGNGWICAYGLRSNLYCSEDAAASWFKIDTGSTSSIIGAHLISDSEFVAAGIGGLTLRVSVVARKATKISTETRETFSDVLALDDKTLLLAGENGVRTLEADLR